jgi:hypothetical protein
MAVARYDGMNDALTDGMTDGRVMKKAAPDRGGIVEQTTTRSRDDRLPYHYHGEDGGKQAQYLQRPDVAHSVPDQVPNLPVVPQV